MIQRTKYLPSRGTTIPWSCDSSKYCSNQQKGKETVQRAHVPLSTQLRSDTHGFHSYLNQENWFMATPGYEIDLENILSWATTYKNHLQILEEGAQFWVHSEFLLPQSSCGIICFESFFLIYLKTLVFLCQCYVYSIKKFKGQLLPSALNY